MKNAFFWLNSPEFSKNPTRKTLYFHSNNREKTLFLSKKICKKTLFFALFLMLFTGVFALICIAIPSKNCALAADKTQEEIKKEFEGSVLDVINGLDLKALQEFLDSLGGEQGEALSIEDLKATLKALVSGEAQNFYQSFLTLLSKSAGRYFLAFAPSFITIMVICLLKNMLCSLTSDFLNNSTSEVVHTVCYSAIVIVLMSGIAGIVKTVGDTIDSMTRFANLIFPLLLTLLSTLGATVTVAGYSPLMAVFCSVILKIVGAVVLPAFVACIVFCVVGNVSKTVKLDKLAKFVKSGASWLVGIVFGLFATFLTVQGVTGGAVDKFAFNVAKFAVSSYVPVLGGYLSDGLDLLSASVVLVKNALGYVGAIVLCSLVLFPIVKVVIFSLTLKLTSSVCEPLGDSRTSNLLFSASKNMNLLVSALAGAAFAFFLLIMLLISSCNMGV